MARLILGGSFNPIHHGHLICARAVAEAREYEGITLIPTAIPPHKDGPATLADFAHRLAMMRLAVADDTFFTIDDLELSRPGPSYTIDTVRILANRNEGPIHWLIGADMLLYLPKWHRIDELLQKVNFIVMARPGSAIDWDTLAPGFRHLEKNVVQAPLIDISASGIRARVAAGKSIKYLTPDAVRQYIDMHGLYRV